MYICTSPTAEGPDRPAQLSLFLPMLQPLEASEQASELPSARKGLWIVTSIQELQESPEGPSESLRVPLPRDPEEASVKKLQMQTPSLVIG